MVIHGNDFVCGENFHGRVNSPYSTATMPPRPHGSGKRGVEVARTRFGYRLVVDSESSGLRGRSESSAARMLNWATSLNGGFQMK